MGIFMQMVNQSKALEAGLGGLVKKMKGKELIIVPVIMILFSLGGAVFGMCEETIAFYVIIMPIILAAGFDAITGVIMILFGAGLGVCASVINPFMIVTSMDAANIGTGHALNLGLSSGIIFRVIIYVILTIIGITFTTLYARKVKNNPQKSLIYDLRELHLKTFQFDNSVVPPLTSKRKIILGVFFSSFVLLILGTIP
ncbi:hypothetical protein FACS1894166_07350 [Bacilli bacterium]|nr:hypothetical protein FACS1894166_07350 [Bacilli bacterium]